MPDSKFMYSKSSLNISLCIVYEKLVGKIKDLGITK